MMNIFLCCRQSDNNHNDFQLPKESKKTTYEKSDEDKTLSIIKSPKFIREATYKEESENDNTSNALNKSNPTTILTFSNLQLHEHVNTENSQIGNKLLLTGELFYNKEIIVNQSGMHGGLRKKSDGQAFFGLINTKDYTGSFYNDLVLNYFRPQNGMSSTGRVFDISFQKKTNDYQLYMIHNSLCIYYEIDNYFYFEDDKEYYMMMGKVFVTIATMVKNNLKRIDIKFEAENEKEKLYSYSQEECPVTIGRAGTVIPINNVSISKKHGTIVYSSQCQKFYYQDLKSTNGSILIIKEDDVLKLKGDMKLKLDDVPFRIMELP